MFRPKLKDLSHSCLYEEVIGSALERVNPVPYQFLNGETMFHVCINKKFFSRKDFVFVQ